MADYCSNCFDKLDALHICDDATSKNIERSLNSKLSLDKSNAFTVVVIAPIAGVVLDLVAPIPSSFINSFILSIFGSAMLSIFWIGFVYRWQRSFRFFLVNLRNFIFTPNLLKVMGANSSKGSVFPWIGIVALSTLLQLLIFTPGNSAYLENQIENKINDATGVNFQAECPKFMFYSYTNRIECRVNTGLLGITVPARVKISPIVGTTNVKVSLI